jgi:hypothetical protein
MNRATAFFFSHELFLSLQVCRSAPRGFDATAPPAAGMALAADFPHKRRGSAALAGSDAAPIQETMD